MANSLNKTNKKESDTLDTNPRPGQYLTHPHSHIARAVAAMDVMASCFGLVRPHQYGIAVEQKLD